MSKLYGADGKPNETWVKREINKTLAPYGTMHVWMPPSNMYGVTGQHDFLICQHGMLWTIEAKAGYNKPTDAQITFAEKIRKAGGLSLMINENNIELIKPVADYIEEYLQFPYHLAHNFLQWRK